MNPLGELLDELDFESWLDYEGVRFKLTRGTRGIQANIRECPCCGNTKWKVYVNTETGLGNCFVCDEKFNKWKFISSYLNSSASDAVSYLKTYSATQGWRPKDMASSPVAKPILHIPPSVDLPINGRNLAYLEERGVSIELAKYFHLQYCHSGKFHYKDAYGNPTSQDYSGRVIIPVYDLDGSIVSFQGRDITGTSDKRYLFPPEFASTGSIIFNGQNAAGASRLVVGEGVFDCIAIKAAMDQDPTFADSVAVASFGKKLGDDQIEKLKVLKARGLKEIIFMWDAEKEALEAAVDSALKCRSNDFITKIALLPKGKDPNEVTADVVRNAINRAIPITASSAIKLKLAARKL